MQMLHPVSPHLVLSESATGSLSEALTCVLTRSCSLFVSRQDLRSSGRFWIRTRLECFGIPSQAWPSLDQTFFNIDHLIVCAAQ